MTPGKRIFACHTVSDSDDFRTATGECATNKQAPSAVGLRNNSDRKWIATYKDGKIVETTNGQAMKLIEGLSIDFGNKNIGEIV